jgi:hypothetical protein
MTERGAGSTGRAARISPLRGLAGQTSGETVALALARKARPAERTDEAELYARRLGRCRPVAVRAAELLWSELVGTAMPAAAAAALGQTLTGFDEKAEGMSADLTIRTLRTALGQSPEQQAYAAFDPEPFGAGPISQVHSAVLHDGRWVAVKIRYHGVSQAVRSALAAPELHRALEPLVRAAAGPEAASRIHAVAGELRGRVEQVLSLRTEAAVQAELAARYQKHPFIRVPGVIGALSTERVLTMELAGGRSRAQAVSAGAAERDRWAEAIYRFAGDAGTVLDPGPGNLLFYDDGAVTFLGFRGAGSLGSEQLRALARRDWAVSRHDADELRALHVEQCGYDDPGTDPERLYAWHSRIRGPLAGPGTRTCTPEWAADAAEAAQPAHRPCAAAHQASKKRDCLFATDADTGLAAVLGALRATADWEAVRTERESGGGGPAATPLGKLESAWQAAGTEKPDVN